ncbi:MAG: alpha/beta hydrolase [Phycisphaerales bacterium]|nr:alpha/beta hydrolase [Phycisphaerales bacterium]
MSDERSVPSSSSSAADSGAVEAILDPTSDAAAVQRRAIRRRRFAIFRWIVRGSALLLIAGAFMFGLDGCFYYPSRVIEETPAAFNLDFEEVRFPSRDGTLLSGWFLPAVGKPRGTIVHFHGNAENISTHIGFVAWAPAAGYHLLVFDYRGYGKSEGRTTRQGTIEDGHAAIDYILTRSETDPRRLIVIGQSLGAAVAAVVVADRPEVRGLILESPFSRYRDIATHHLRQVFQFELPSRALAASLVSAGHEPIDAIRRIAPRPLLVIVSGEDAICPPHLGQALFDAASEPKELWSLPNGGHTEAFVYHTDEAIRRFEALVDRAAAAHP